MLLNERPNTLAVREKTAIIKTLIAEDLDVNVGIDEIDDHVSLLEKGLALDSVVIVELINLLEDRFGFHFDDEDMKPDLFASVTTLAEFVTAKKSPPENGGV